MTFSGVCSFVQKSIAPQKETISPFAVKLRFFPFISAKNLPREGTQSHTILQSTGGSLHEVDTAANPWTYHALKKIRVGSRLTEAEWEAG